MVKVRDVWNGDEICMFVVEVCWIYDMVYWIKFDDCVWGFDYVVFE